MHALLIALHGTRLAEANYAMQRMVAEIAATCEGHWDSVGLGFLQFGAPPLGGALEQLARSGVRKITLVPLFLGAGRHVEEDIPQAVEIFSRAHPEVDVLVTPHFGAWRGLAAAVAALAYQAETSTS